MSFLSTDCTLTILSEEVLKDCEPFDCGSSDLNDFFLNDSQNYAKELLGKSYCFLLDKNPNVIVCAFTISNDSIKVSSLPNNRKSKLTKKIPHQKRMKSYPAVLIGRLGVNNTFKRKGLGDELLNFIKSWFIDPYNKTGCRFLVVDAYNEDIPIKYYQKNGFDFLFSTEDQEKAYSQSVERPLTTRLMYFDLIELSTTFTSKT